MRVSCEVDDADYIPFSEARDVEVYLDGVYQSPGTTGRGVIMADDSEGIIVFHEMVDGDTYYRPFKTEGGKYAKFTLRGSVKIVRPDYVIDAS